MGERETPLPSEELHKKTREVYYHLPEYTPQDELATVILETSPEERDEIFEAVANRRKNSESREIIVRKFDELISQSPTTAHYKSAIHFLFDQVSKLGRSMEEDIAVEYELDKTLIDSLQIEGETNTGIYALAGAKKGEEILFEFLIQDFANGMIYPLAEGLDPTSLEAVAVNPVLPYPLMEQKEFLLEWHKEFTKLYGEPPAI